MSMECLSPFRTPSWAASCRVELGHIWISGPKICSELHPGPAWDILIFPLLPEWKFLSPAGSSCRSAWDGSLSNLCRQVSANLLLWEPPGGK